MRSSDNEANKKKKNKKGDWGRKPIESIPVRSGNDIIRDNDLGRRRLLRTDINNIVVNRDKLEENACCSKI